MRHALNWICVFGLLTVTKTLSGADPAHLEFFEKKIRPVLVEHCFQCHSEQAGEGKGGLFLDSRTGWATGGDSGPAIEPGDPQASLLLESLRYESYEMPPAGKLPEAVIKDFEQWIAQGAVDPRESQGKGGPAQGIDWEAARQFWAFRPLPEADPSDFSLENHSQTSTWVTRTRQIIDEQLTSALKKQGISANSAASPEKRIRRLYYDLTGLPPTPQQILDFVNDPSAARWEATIDSLLARTEFGEQWGRHWLDVVRYADSNGGDFNATYHNAWRYRDYVIQSFNDDKPIDLFFEEQIAGDLLPARNEQDRTENLVATGFLMVGPKMLSERDKEKLLYDVIDEQIDSFGKVFLGLSLGCARCHDHKFDPIPTADYYALAGIFRGTQVLNGEMQQYVSDWLRRDLPTSPEHLQQVQNYRQELAETKTALKQSEVLLKELKLNLEKLKQGQETLLLDNSQAKLVGDWVSSTFSPAFLGKDYIHDNKEDKGEKKAIFTAQLPRAGAYQVEFAYLSNTGRDEQVPVRVISGDQVTKLLINQTKAPQIEGRFVSLGEFQFPAGAEVQVVISTEETTGYVIVDAVRFVSLEAMPQDEQSQEKLAAAQAELKQHQAVVIDLRAKVKALQATSPPPIAQAIAVQDREECEDCTIMIRGEHTKPGLLVPRGTLKIISGERAVLEIPQGSGRQQLAHWLTTEALALTSRVYVNRVWMSLMGEGIVRTVDDFGVQGTPPTHPELLDQLALRFTKNQWSTKQLIKAIVMTAAYQRSTDHQAEAYAIDPENLLFWRMHRRPLTAEELRDSLIVFQGKLDPQSGGSTVTHLGRLAVDNSKQANAAVSSEYAWRRSVYHPVLRNQLTDIFVLFDFANPEMVVGKRPATNVPAQSLFLLNNPQAEQTARQVVELLFQKHGEGSFSSLVDLYLMVYGRLPRQQDDQVLQSYLSQRLQDEVKDEKVRDAWAEVVQAMLASTEFRYLD